MEGWGLATKFNLLHVSVLIQFHFWPVCDIPFYGTNTGEGSGRNFGNS